MVEKRPTRKWTNEEEAKQLLTSLGKKPEEFLEAPELKSVAQVEKLFGKKKFGDSPLAGFVEKKSSGRSMVPDTDPRPALSLTAGEEFAAIPAGEIPQAGE
jgi:hypothetical protein